MMLQPIIDLAEICVQSGITDVVISPGSRSAPLTLAFARHSAFKTHIVPDERAAAFIALGKALISKKPVVLICTSGSAAVNYFPAVAEAYFQQVPLLLLTADRPKELIGRPGEQNIFQDQVFGKHVKKSVTLSEINDIIIDALKECFHAPKGPVHINIPVKEPFYPKPGEVFLHSADLEVFSTDFKSKLSKQAVQDFISVTNKYEKILIVSGQQQFDKQLLTHLSDWSTRQKIPVVGDVIANIHLQDEVIQHHDLFLHKIKKEKITSLRPDLLITFGNSVLSKNLKQFLLKNPPQLHVHIQPHEGSASIQFALPPKIITVSPKEFFRELSNNNTLADKRSDAFLSTWQDFESKTQAEINGFFPCADFTELQVVKTIIDYLPENCLLHLANSMSVRYVNILGLKGKNNEVFSNRGVCGIDGCTSTAVGAALNSPEKLNLLITGDMAFFYDRNALWHNDLPSNLRIIILNDHGGGIFRKIDGPPDQPENEEFFVTCQRLRAENTARDFDFDYYFCEELNHLERTLDTFFKSAEKPKILEIETDGSANAVIYNKFKSLMQNL